MILKFVQNTFTIEIKVDQKIPNLIEFFAFVLSPCWLKVGYSR